MNCRLQIPRDGWEVVVVILFRSRLSVVVVDEEEREVVL